MPIARRVVWSLVSWGLVMGGSGSGVAGSGRSVLAVDDVGSWCCLCGGLTMGPLCLGPASWGGGVWPRGSASSLSSSAVGVGGGLGWVRAALGGLVARRRCTGCPAVPAAVA